MIRSMLIYLLPLFLVLSVLPVSSFGEQNDGKSIQTQELPPPPGMGGTGSSSPENRSAAKPAPTGAAGTSAPGTQGSYQAEKQETQPPASMTTELRQEERQAPDSISPEQRKPLADSKSKQPTRPRQPVAAFWLVLPPK